MTTHGVGLGQIRLVELQLEWLAFRNGEVTVCNRTLSRGLGIRVLDGGWGYAASQSIEEPEAVVDRSVALARAAAPHAYERIAVGENPPAVGHWRSPCEVDPFSVPLDEKLDWLREATQAMGDVSVASAQTMALKRVTQFVSTEGSDWTQEQVITGVSIGATAVKDGLVQIRTWPKSEDGNVAGRGWEYVLSHNIHDQAPKIAEEARQLLHAPKVPEGEHDIILDSAQLSLQIHESCGHPVEGDRVLGEEMSLAGGSFLQPSQVGERYGSDLVNLYAEGDHRGGSRLVRLGRRGFPSHPYSPCRRGDLQRLALGAGVCGPVEHASGRGNEGGLLDWCPHRAHGQRQPGPRRCRESGRPDCVHGARLSSVSKPCVEHRSVAVELPVWL